MKQVVISKTMVQMAGQPMTLEEEHQYALALLHSLLTEQAQAGHTVEGWEMEMKMHLLTITVTYTRGKNENNGKDSY
jgi:hypothetical protein